MEFFREVVVVAALLQRKHWRLATAESCTGGLIAHWMTAMPGCSAWYAGGVVAYANHAKTALLGVPAALIAEHGAVSAAVVAAMAHGVLERLEAEVAVSTSGIAGPSGGTAEKPVGLVYVGVAMRGGSSRTAAFQFNGTRTAVQIAAGHAALKMVEELLVV